MRAWTVGRHGSEAHREVAPKNDHLLVVQAVRLHHPPLLGHVQVHGLPLVQGPRLTYFGIAQRHLPRENSQRRPATRRAVLGYSRHPSAPGAQVLSPHPSSPLLR